MKIERILGLLIVTFVFAQAGYASGKITSNCTYKGKPLYGKVKVVDSFEDFKVKKVTSFEDIRVKEVTSFPDRCGRWQYVNSFEDFKIKFVEEIFSTGH